MCCWIWFVIFWECLHLCFGSPFQHSCLENFMDRGAWWATVHGVAKSQTGLSNTYLCSWEILVCGFLMFLSHFGPIKWGEKCFLVLLFLKCLWRSGVIFFKYVMEFTSEINWAWAFFVGRYFITNSIYLLARGLLRSYISFWVCFNYLCLFRDFSITEVI